MHKLMFNILIALIISVAAGYCLRRFDKLRGVLAISTTITVLVLLFVFGTSLGSNDTIISNLHRDGVKAVVIALAGVGGSIAATLIYRRIQGKGGAR